MDNGDDDEANDDQHQHPHHEQQFMTIAHHAGVALGNLRGVII